VAPALRAMRQRYAIQICHSADATALDAAYAGGTAGRGPGHRETDRASCPRLRIFSDHIGRGRALCTGPWQALPTGVVLARELSHIPRTISLSRSGRRVLPLSIAATVSSRRLSRSSASSGGGSWRSTR
jgi:hypothetical protein